MNAMNANSVAHQKDIFVSNFDQNCNQMKIQFSKIYLYTQVARISELKNAAMEGTKIKQQYKPPKLEQISLMLH